jgi:hypothetical protein
VPSVLALGTPALQISGPAAGTATGAYSVGKAAFGPALNSTGVSGQLMPVSTPATGAACLALAGADATAVNGRIALIDRGVCGFAVKVKNAQNAGAIGVVIADNAAGSPAADLGGADPTITIPAIRITLPDAIALKAKLVTRSRTSSGVVATLKLDMSQRAGADLLNRAMLFTPNPYQSGSSVSHFDTSGFPNLLMEPSINADLGQSLLPPQDLTFKLLQDTGW